VILLTTRNLTMIEFDQLPILEKISYALSKNWGYYKFYRIRKDKRGWRYTGEEKYCPCCRRVSKVCIAGFMNARTPFGVLIEYERCEICLIKLPVVDKAILKKLGYYDKPKELPIGQMTL